jgi:ABC-2 type transport system ATP-binding protein
MSRNLVEIKNLVKKFGDFTAVNDLSLEIKEGQIFGILGPNGAGKTTTINMILGLLIPSSGKIYINGIDAVAHNEEVKKMMGFMTQETVVEGDLTAQENLELFASLYHVPENEVHKRVREALAEAELTEFAGKKAGTFSGGMQRRLSLVKSMIQHPKLLILDEPTTGLDIQNRVNMWGHIRDLVKTGVTVILTTQYLEEADELCDMIAVIDHGKVKAIGTALELKKMVGSGRVLELIVENASEAQEAFKILKSKFKLNPILADTRITAVIEKDSDNTLTEILYTLDRNKIVITSVNLHLPTLDDAFIKLTGGAMRDSASGSYNSAAANVFLKMR